jgi:hypothetical protein
MNACGEARSLLDVEGIGLFVGTSVLLSIERDIERCRRRDEFQRGEVGERYRRRAGHERHAGAAPAMIGMPALIVGAVPSSRQNALPPDTATNA